jgi:hypothetical protein
LRTKRATADIAPKKGPVDALQLGLGIDPESAEKARSETDQAGSCVVYYIGTMRKVN